MITYHKGNLLDAPVQALVNTVNTVGVMGKGIALQFKERFRYNFQVYQQACKNGTLQPGHLLVVEELTTHGAQLIINFPTKTHWRGKSQYAYIEAGLRELVTIIATHHISSLALPPLGCGHGGLQWERVRSLIEQYLADSPAAIQVFEPNEQVSQLLAQHEQPQETKLTPARAMLLYSLFAYESLGEEASVFAANKLAYFLQRLGEPSIQQPTFVAHHYGPYSVAVQHVLYALNGTYLRGLEQNEARAFARLELNYERLPEVKEYLRKQLSVAQLQKLNELLELVEGFQSALSLEVLASVDFLLKEQPKQTVEQLVECIQSWSPRKKKLISPYHVEVAYEHLQRHKHATFLATA